MDFKIYLFVMALTLLGAGFEPFIERYLLDLHPYVLYWINMISAVLDNATLAAAEISPTMDEPTIRAILLGLLISGGMLIPGNIPNIIAAGKLNIQSVEWARFGFPLGLIVMAVYFVIIVTIRLNIKGKLKKIAGWNKIPLCDLFVSYFFFEIRVNRNAPAAKPIIVFIFLLNTCLTTRFRFCGLSASRRMK